MLNHIAMTESGVPIEFKANDIHLSPTEADRAAVNDILVDCLFAVGQAVGMRKTLEFGAVQWWRAHFSEKFLRAISVQGNRWEMDRDAVSSVAMLFGERAVRYAGDADSISVAALQQAAADVERYCRTLATRQTRAMSSGSSEQPLMAGYWCTL